MALFSSIPAIRTAQVHDTWPEKSILCDFIENTFCQILKPGHWHSGFTVMQSFCFVWAVLSLCIYVRFSGMEEIATDAILNEMSLYVFLFCETSWN